MGVKWCFVESGNGEDLMDKMLNLDDIASTTDTDEVVKSVLASGEFDPTKEAGSVLPYLRKVSINDLVPIEYQDQLMALDSTLSSCFWQIGDITDVLINSVNRERSANLGKLVSNTDIFYAVGYFCHRTSRTIRHYYENSRFFSPKTRAKYNIPYNIFVLARWVKDWELMLQLAEDNPQLSSEAVRNLYYKTIGEKPPVSEKDGSAETGSAETGSADSDEELEESGKFKAVLLAKLDHTVDDLRSVLDRINLPTSVRVRIGEVLLEISDITLTIRREV
jgi:hypothetical protein